MKTNILSKRSFFSAVAAFACCASLSFASPVTVDNEFDTNLTGSTWTNDNTGWRTWDDFTISSTTTFTAAAFQSYVAAPSSTANYQFDIVSDAAGSLGASVFSMSVPFASVLRTAYVGPAFSSAYEHNFSLPSITLAAGTYWVSLTSTANLYGSSGSAGDALIQVQLPGGTQNTRTTSALPFQLTGSTSVPDNVSMLALLGLSMTALVGFRRMVRV